MGNQVTSGPVELHTTVRLSPGSSIFRCEPGESILNAGQRAGFTFPQACRNGNCFRCEAQLLAGEVVHQRTGVRSTVTADDDAAPILPCIVTAQRDCVIAGAGLFAPGALPVVTAAAQVIAVSPLTASIVRIQLRLPAGKKITRLAGQYLEIVDGDNAYAFSIASAPASGRELELHVRFGEDNPSSMRVVELLRAGAVVNVRLPMGDCTLISEPRLPLLFVAGSTGFSQVKAFVEHALAQGWQVPISIYWGARTAADLYLRDDAERWALAHTNVRFVAVVSGAGPVMDGRLRAGLVHEAVLADAPDFANLLVYVCGSPPLVYAALDAFVAKGLPAERMFSDVFAWSPRPPAAQKEMADS